MIPISKIDATFSVYKNKAVVIWGTGSAAEWVWKYLTIFQIPVVAFTDNNREKWGTLFWDIPVCSISEILEKYKKDDILIQIGSSYEKSISIQLNELSIDYILYSEAKYRLYGYYLRSISDSYIPREKLLGFSTTYHEDATFKYVLNHILPYLKCKHKEHLLLWDPAKTGSSTLRLTFDSLKLDYIPLLHLPCVMTLLSKVNSDKPIKIITAVREPISQNLSLMYQLISDTYFADYMWMFDEIWQKNGDINKLLNNIEIHWLKDTKKDVSLHQITDYTIFEIYMIQNYWKDFNKYILDITDYQFNKEDGYTIIKKDNMEIFVYQLEKLNKVWPVLTSWLNISDTPLMNDNEAKNKWYNESYHQAKKELVFSQEYFDECFNQPYVKHCYSEEDIEKFKQKWRSHIKK